MNGIEKLASGPKCSSGRAIRGTSWRIGIAVVVAVYGAGAAFSRCRADDELSQRTTWAPADPAQVRQELEAWLRTREITVEQRAHLDAIWIGRGPPSPGAEVLDRVIQSTACVEPDARELAAFLKSDTVPTPIPRFAILDSESLPILIRGSLKLGVGRWLAQRELFDEALEQLTGLKVDEVVDPASLLFYRSVAHHQLLKKEQCLPDLTLLMRNEDSIPRRFQTMARLMQADLQALKPDSLDEVARMMDDIIRRRLELGRAGRTVRKEEDDVIEKLDKMIEQLEQQQQQQQQQSSGGSAAPSQPRPDSTPGGVKGPGNVDARNIGNKAGWGNLPPKERQEAMQNLSKDLPAHHTDAIKQYLKKLAQEERRR